MNEQTWLESSEPVSMMKFIVGQASERKLRLLLVAMARFVWDQIPEGDLREAVIIAEQHADGMTPLTVLDEYRQRCYGWAMDNALPEQRAFFSSAETNPIFTLARMTTYPPHMLRSLTVQNSNWNAQARRLGMRIPLLIREIVGNPFRSAAFDVAWRTFDVRLLSNGIYEEKAFDRMPILADALQDAGCDDDALLLHLRDTSTQHVRGCWALDLVLGKE